MFLKLFMPKQNGPFYRSLFLLRSHIAGDSDLQTYIAMHWCERFASNVWHRVDEYFRSSLVQSRLLSISGIPAVRVAGRSGLSRRPSEPRTTNTDSPVGAPAALQRAQAAATVFSRIVTWWWLWGRWKVRRPPFPRLLNCQLCSVTVSGRVGTDTG